MTSMECVLFQQHYFLNPDVLSFLNCFRLAAYMVKRSGWPKEDDLTFYIDNECLEYFCNFFFRIRMSPFLNQLHLVIVLITIVEAFKMPCYLVDCANHPLPTTTFLFFSFSYFHQMCTVVVIFKLVGSNFFITLQLVVFGE